MKKKPQLPEIYKGVKDPDMLFDLICAANWFNGNLDGKMPVDQIRQAFAYLKTLL